MTEAIAYGFSLNNSFCKNPSKSAKTNAIKPDNKKINIKTIVKERYKYVSYK